MNYYEVLVRPVITEKAVTAKEEADTLCFEVRREANKTQIRQAVEKLFSVKVADIRTVRNTGKLRRRGRFAGYKQDWKKAYVRLKPGQKLPEFAEV